ncbi:Xaa-Pro dipeptidase [Novosphingobium resinovorum]|uniref:Xaa-Pro dipeptidase n=1 Tax=Novosphingobium resinovorum TaxID=158500 RepID=UPI0022F275E4|nr:amidohydrolase family protein [Novosphingobium resinovorum]
MAPLVLAGLSVPASAASVYVRAGRLLDVESGTASTGQCVLVEGERVARVEPCAAPPPGAETLDWSAYTVLPGLIDLHTHLADTGQSADVAAPLKTSPQLTALIGAHNAKVTLEAGFTTVRDVGTYRGLTDVALRDAIAQGLVPGPRMFVAGAYITSPGGGGELNGVVPNDQLPADMRLGVVHNAGEAREKAQYLFDHGADFIKMIATGAVLAIGTEPGQIELSDDEMRAVVDVAKAHGSYATAHAHGTAGIKAAIRSGVHSIEHASLIDDEGLAMAKKAGVWLVMDIYDGDWIDEQGTREGWPQEYLRKNRETTQQQRDGFAKAVKLGVRLGFGTDAGVYPHGLNARQFAYMVRYGMTPAQAIRSATIDAAALIGHEKELGSIAPGKFADMIAVTGDPLSAVRVLEQVAYVMKAGAVAK